MTYKRFEDLPVWRSALDLADRAFALADDRGFDRQGDVRNQLQRAALSVSNNIAEGFERGSTAELLQFIYIARGSAGEVRSILYLCDRRPTLKHLKSEISDLRSLAESCSRQLRAWAESLQNSEVKGQRHLNDAARERDGAERRRATFLADLKRRTDRAAEERARGSADPASG